MVQNDDINGYKSYSELVGVGCKELNKICRLAKP